MRARGQGPFGQSGACQRRHVHGCTGDLAQLRMPVRQRLRVDVVQFHRRKQGACTLRIQPLFDTPREPAELRVLAVSQRQHRVGQVRQFQALPQQPTLETACRIRGFAIAKRADHKQRMPGALQCLCIQLRQRAHLHRQAGSLQMPGGLPRQALGKTALAGKRNQPWCRLRGRCCALQHLARRAQRTFFAAPIQI